MQICISGIHTDVGKTHVSAMLCAILKYDYFKIIQAGLPKDSQIINFFSPQTIIHQEGYFLKTPASPHIGKIIENAHYSGLSLKIPQRENLIIETAGGLFSPLDEESFMIDFITKNNLSTLLVGRYYLGAINHLLLSIEALKSRHVKLLGIIMVGDKDDKVDSLITQHTKLTILNLAFFNQDNFKQVQDDFSKQITKIL